jgi:ribonucleoside-diphosphate reductase alpha chain
VNVKAEIQTAVPMQEASTDIWRSKYQLTTKSGEVVDASLSGTMERVAKALAEVEAPEKRQEWAERFLWVLENGAIPAGRIISNAGAQDHKPATSTINCTVSGTIYDSMDDILGKNHEAGMTLKAGAGIGYEFSTLRPKGSYVAGAGSTTSGPMSFMDIFDKMCFTVSSAGGRRGAQMATFDVHHPDVFDFIRAKREDGRLRQFNLSLLITDDFIDAVKTDADWHLSFPITRKEVESEHLDLGNSEKYLFREFPISTGYVTNAQGHVACRIYRTVKARAIWNAIMSSTYDFAEPGFILIDKVNEMNNNWFCENIRATNPCVTQSTWVHTARGPRQVKDLIGQSFQARVDGRDHASGAEGFFKTADKPVVHLKTAEGYSLRLTSDHRVRKVTHFSGHETVTQWCAAGHLQPGDRVLLNDHRANTTWAGNGSREQGYLLGLVVGDGTMKTDTSVLSIWKPAAVVNGCSQTGTGVDGVIAEALQAASTQSHRSDFCGGILSVCGHNEYRLRIDALNDLVQDFGMQHDNKTVTPAVETASSDFYRGFLRGLFDADGSVQGIQTKGVSVRLSQSDLPALEAVQRMLLRLGIVSTLYQGSTASQHQVMAEAQNELVISGDNLATYATHIGFANTDKSASLTQALTAYKRKLNHERFTARVTEVTADGVEAVYDVQVPGINTFDANGYHSHNCGEQPLPPYGSCLLGSVNLTCFVDHPFTEKATFNYKKYAKVVSIFTRMLDNVVEINGLPLEGQRHEIQYKRRHGMGILGLGSTLTMLRMPYGSPESVVFTENVNKEMALEGWREGLRLSKEKGPAPIMEDEFTVTERMLSLRPEMVNDGFKPGDKVKGKVLHARYSRYMQRIAQADSKLVDELAKHG